MTDFDFEISANLRRFLRHNGSRSVTVARADGFLSSDTYTSTSVNQTSRLIYTTEVLIDQPLGYYRLDEALSSSPAADSSGHALDGAYTGGVTTVPGNLYFDNNTAMSFDGTGYLFVPAGSMHSTGMLEGVFRITSGTAPMIRDASTGSAGWAMGYDHGAGTFGIRAGGLSWDTGVVISDYVGLWTHYVMRKVDDNIFFYVNGSSLFAAQGASTAAASASTWYVMKDGTGSGKLTGRADEISLYSGSIGHERPLQHYRAYAGIPG